MRVISRLYSRRNSESWVGGRLVMSMLLGFTLDAWIIVFALSRIYSMFINECRIRPIDGGCGMKLISLRCFVVVFSEYVKKLLYREI